MVLKQIKYHLVYPHQLFECLFDFEQNTEFLLIEDPLFFRDTKYPRNFHKQKIVLHRASMMALADRLRASGYAVHYFDYSNLPLPSKVADFLKDKQSCEITVYDPVDNILQKRLEAAFRKFEKFYILETPNFLTTLADINSFFKDRQKYLFTSFYIYQRKRLNVLIADNNPVGGKWSFDVENRKKLPKEVDLPKSFTVKQNQYVKEAINYANKYFADNPGSVEEFNYPIDHVSAKRALTDFIDKRFFNFGVYEDAIAENESVLFHSNLSAILNIGLLSPKGILDSALKMLDKVPIASLEGFVRQIIGWREYMRAVYFLKGTEMRTKNFLGHKDVVPASWYNGTTGIYPIDATIKKVLKYAYCHHIERLMILGNVMLLLNIDPDEVYGWFMDMFIDAYDWVMVPNVYAMSQFADGGTITTKPYFSSSNYILKMSDYKKGDWVNIVDALFYRFIDRHKLLINQNPRLKILLKNLERLPEEKRVVFSDCLSKYK